MSPRPPSPWPPIGTAFVVALAAAAGCRPSAAPIAAPSGPLLIPPLDIAAAPVDAVRFPEGAAVPSGCFAQTRHGREVACILGEYGARSTSGERRLVRLTNTEDGFPPLPIHTRLESGVVVLENESRKMLDELMRAGDFVALGGATAVPVNSKREIGGLLIELDHPSSGRLRGDLKLVVRDSTRPTPSLDDADGDRDSDDGQEDDELFHNTLSLVRCDTATLAVRVLANGPVLVERECRRDQGGDAHVVLGAWLCDRELASCD
jgi:hypothetical protein